MRGAGFSFAAAAAGWPAMGRAQSQAGGPAAATDALDQAIVPLPDPSDPRFGAAFDHLGDAKVVLLGEATHGTSEFYRARAEISKHLVREHGFNIIAVEADWPDAARVDAYIRGHEPLSSATSPFQRFPTWMWRNEEMTAFVDWLKVHNAGSTAKKPVAFYGLDLYSLPSSMDAVTSALGSVDEAAAAEARRRYGCLATWRDAPQAYGLAAQEPSFDTCAGEVVSVLEELVDERLRFLGTLDPRLFLDVAQNARLVAASEEYYRTMYQGSIASWNLRDTYMFETLETVLAAHGADAKAIVWAHNSHVGDAAATQLGQMGEINIGHLARKRFGDEARLVGFGTDRGTVIAASEWDGPPETKEVRPSLPESYGALFRGLEASRFLLDLRSLEGPARDALDAPELERAIGVIYRPESERMSHYFEADLAAQFDHFVWFEETQAVAPLGDSSSDKLPSAHPFAG